MCYFGAATSGGDVVVLACVGHPRRLLCESETRVLEFAFGVGLRVRDDITITSMPRAG